jgi:hypothetical protein
VPPLSQVTLPDDHSRLILAHNDSPDLGFRWSVNPYRGCQHACAYATRGRATSTDLGAVPTSTPRSRQARRRGAAALKR